nr:methyltransferase [uncultured Rhodoferax sp.]
MTHLFLSQRQRIGQLLVVLQFGLLAWLGWAASAPIGHGQWTATSTWLAALSLLLGSWTLAYNRLGNFNIHPAPKAQGVLITGGPYRLIRHPMYSAVLLAAGAMAVLLETNSGWLVWCALALVLWTKAHLEERWLCEHHAGYAAYCQHTHRFIPWLV